MASRQYNLVYNASQPAVQTKSEILDCINALTTADKGPPRSVEVKSERFNAAGNGELVFSRIKAQSQIGNTGPDNVIFFAAVEACINTNPGIAFLTFGCPARFMANQLNDSAPDGIVYDGVIAADQRIGVATDGNLFLGRLGEGNVYTDDNELVSAQPVRLLINNNSSVDFTILKTSSLVLNISATQALTIKFVKDVVVPFNPGPSFSAFQKNYYIDIEGNIYLQQALTNEDETEFTYEEACKNRPN